MKKTTKQSSELLKAVGVAVVTLFLLFVPTPGQADTLTDPAVLFLNSGTPYLYKGGTEVHAIPFNTVNLLENGNGQPALLNPVLLILGIPNTNSFVLPSITLTTGTGSVGSNNAGSFTASYAGSPNDVYNFLGFSSKGDGSENFANWSGADSAVLGITATGFQIGYYDLNNTGLTGGSSVNIKFGGSLPIGTFVVAFACSGSKPPAPCDSTGNTFSTPFTESGLSVPEPSSLFLLGSGMLGLALWGRKRFRKLEE